MGDTLRQVLVGLAIGIPSFLLGVLGWYRLKRSDSQTLNSKQVDQLLAGYNEIFDDYQDKYKELKAENTKLRAQLRKIQADCRAIRSKHEELTRELATYKKKR